MIQQEKRMRRANRQAGPPAARDGRSHRAGRAGKMLVPLLGVLAVLAMIGVGAVAYLLQQEREKREATERDLNIALAEKEDLKAQFEELQQSSSRIEEELSRVRKDFTAAQGELAKAVEARDALSRSVEDREQEIARVTKDLAQAQGESKQAAGQLSELQAERDTMKRQMADLEKAKGDLESKVLELSNRPTVELDKVMVSGESGAMDAGMPLSVSATTGKQGEVVVINREYDFVVMNLGKNHGLTVGQEFQILRGSEVLGRVKVEKIYDELSAAAILPDSQKDAIKEGDLVKAL